MLRWQVVTEGFEQLYQALVRVDKAIRDDPAAMEDLGKIAVDGIRKNFRRKSSPSGTPWKPAMRWGRVTNTPLRDKEKLYNSFRVEAMKSGFRIIADDPKASVHNEGKTISTAPKKMAIPLSRRYAGKSPLDYEEAFVIKTGANSFIVRRVSAGRDGLEFMYLLKDRVKIPRRPFMGLSADVREKIVKRFGVTVSRRWV